VGQREDFAVRFWGVRGSVAVPGPETVRFGGNTSCVEMRCGDRKLVFDGGTGLRPLGKAWCDAAPVEADLFFSHTHFDHICGLPFFAPAFDPRNVLRLWAGHLGPDNGLKKVLSSMMSPPLFPVPLDVLQACMTISDFRCGDTLYPAADVAVRTAPLDHPGGATGYRVEYDGRSVCYVTDTNHEPGAPNRDILGLIAGADIVIYDSMFTDEEFERFPTWGHSTWREGMRLCDAAGAKMLVLFHHDPSRTDDALDEIAAIVERERPGTVVAREGLVLVP